MKIKADVKKFFSHNTILFHKEKKVPSRSFFSFFAFFAVLLLFCGCSFGKNTDKTILPSTEEKNIRKMKRVENIRILRMLLVEKGQYILAERVVTVAAEQLGLRIRITKTLPEHVYPLLRADKADLAFCGTAGSEENKAELLKELKRFRMEGYLLHLQENKGKHSLFFIMGRGSEELWTFLERAAHSAAANGKIDFTFPQETVNTGKSPVSGSMQESRNEKKLEKLPSSAEKQITPSGEKSREKKKNKREKRELLRSKIYRSLQRKNEMKK